MAEYQRTGSTSSDLLNLGNGLLIDESWEVSISGVPDVNARVHVALIYDQELGRYAVERVTLERDGPGEEVTGTNLRELRLQDHAGHAALSGIWVHDDHIAADMLDPDKRNAAAAIRKNLDDGTTIYPAGRIIDAIRPFTRPANDTDAMAAALLYKIGTVAYLPALRLVCDRLEISHTTAIRLTNRARDLGIL